MLMLKLKLLQFQMNWNVEIAAISKILAYKSWFLSFWKKVKHKIHHIFDNEAENKLLKFLKYRYQPMNGWYIGIGLKKAISVYL